jgi:hypothetical protein
MTEPLTDEELNEYVPGTPIERLLLATIDSLRSQLAEANERRVDETVARRLAEAALASAREVVEAAKEVVSPCNVAMNNAPRAKRHWCLTHQEWTPCPMEALRTALASLEGTNDE